MVLYYLDVTYMVTYMETELHLSLSVALAINTISIIAMCLAMLLFGYMSDIYGRKKMHIIGYLLLLLCTIPLVVSMESNSIYVVARMVVSIAVLTAMIQEESTPYYIEIFLPRVRATCYSIVFGFVASLSGFATMIAVITMGYVSATKGLCLLLLIVGIISLIIAIIIPSDQAKIRRVNCLNS